jgi:hypothetical protein
MRLYTQDQLLRLIKLYNTADESEKKLLKPYCDQAILKYFNHKLKTKKCEDETHIAAHLESAVMASVK